MGVERPAIGRVIGGKYRIERPLGAGAWAQVYLAEHVELHTKVAIKLLSNWESCSEKHMSRFLREARAAARLKTVHVCRVLDVGRTEEGAPFTVLEHLDGTDLQHVVEEQGRLEPDTAVEFMLQACEGLAEAHANGIVHRDLKPANMFLTAAPDGSPLVKILDFGISKELTGQKIDIHLTRSTDLLGTPFYMSPEQLRDAAEVDARTDIWSMGVILWRMISGEMPFEGGSFAELCVSIMTGPPPTRGLEHVPEGLVEPLNRCLAKDPAQRYENVRQLAGALSHWLSGEESTRVDRIGRMLARLGSAAEDTAGGPAAAREATPVPALAPVAVPVGALDPTLAASPVGGPSTDDKTSLYGSPPSSRRRLLMIGALGAGLAMAAAAVAIVAFNDGDSGAASAATDAGARGSSPAPAMASDPPPAETTAPSGATADEPVAAPEAPTGAPTGEPTEEAASAPPTAPATRRTLPKRATDANRKRKERPRSPAAPKDLYDRRH